MRNEKRMIMEDIFDLSISKKERDFVKSGVNLELEVTTNILETICEIPYIGSMVKLGRLANRFQDLHFIIKLAKFLQKEQDIPKEKKVEFLNSLSSNERKKMYEYITHYLLRAEDDAKADVMGYIYKDRIYGQINNEMFLRLCSIVDRAFIFDLKTLPKYEKENNDPNNVDNVIVNSLMNLGLIDNEIDNGAWGNRTIIELNEVGLTLHRILNQNGWYQKRE